MGERWPPVIRAAKYGTADGPAFIQTPNHNGPKPTVPRVVVVSPFVDSDVRPLVDRILDQNWRDAVSLGLLEHHPASINPVAPGGG
jgi:hypothetical protein